MANQETHSVDASVSPFPQESESKSINRLLIVTSVAAERDALVRGLNTRERTEKKVDLLVGGVGQAAAAAATASCLASSSYDLVICAGIAGGFPGQAEIGSLVIADKVVAADLGAETTERFLPIEELGFGTHSFSTSSQFNTHLETALQKTKLSIHRGAILTVSTVTGTQATMKELLQRIPEAKAEAMEGFGVATAADLFGIPMLEIRAISNLVGPRQRSAWRIEAALATLELACPALLEV